MLLTNALLSMMDDTTQWFKSFFVFTFLGFGTIEKPLHHSIFIDSFRNDEIRYCARSEPTLILKFSLCVTVLS